ncbi:hypothetical protein LEP1GSC050_1888 [Leptospira broomii serovar Hurstbridge str. 5399]|uniref:Uncharacterized protein n=1 Tax=Leptospira broomii serovar Hurstbridge str. 5399 TaxID=1049789 RepID=T0F7C2_9LEPT|nr:hypothetical protein LEP1GSC050_1888 [Leptospira broomii serovar Hurstbridge str. 5399]
MDFTSPRFAYFFKSFDRKIFESFATGIQPQRNPALNKF